MKRTRVKGLEYINWKGKSIAAIPSGINNNCNCRRKCYSQIADDDREQIFRQFRSLETKTEQDCYLQSLIAVTEVKQRRRRKTPEESSKPERACSYVYEVSTSLSKVSVCKTAFLNLHGVSSNRVRRLCLLLAAGKSPVDRRGKSTLVDDCKKRWRSIRDTHNRQKKPKTLKKTARCIKYRHTWPLAAKLSFLDNVEQERSFATKIIKLESQKFEEEETEIGLPYVDVIDRMANYSEESRVSALDADNPLKQNDSSIDSHSIESSSPGQQYTVENFPSNPSAEQTLENGIPWRGGTNDYSCKKRKFNEKVLGSETSELLKGPQNKNDFILEEFDSLEIFFKSMNLTMKQLQPAMVAEAKMKICKIVTDLELKALQLTSVPNCDQASTQDLKQVQSESLNSDNIYQDLDGPNTLPEVDEDSEIRVPITQASSVSAVSSRVGLQLKRSGYLEKEDEFDVVGRRIAYQLRGMEERQSLIAEKLLSDVMFQGRLGKLDENSFICLSPST